jgi:hypothetical protein
MPIKDKKRISLARQKAKIYLSGNNRNEYAVVDAEDVSIANKYDWYLQKSTRGRTSYAVKTIYDKQTKKYIQLRMHRFILGLTDNKVLVDHINGNGLDNRRENLRIATNSQNQTNRSVSSISKLGVKGVTFVDKNKNRKYCAYVTVDKKWIGSYHKTLKEAALAYNEMAKKYYGEYARLNEV